MRIKRVYQAMTGEYKYLVVDYYGHTQYESYSKVEARAWLDRAYPLTDSGLH